ncbi:MAG: BTAD domain-containing putative transcriptional regulator [Acidimicrobiales bacterium]
MIERRTQIEVLGPVRVLGPDGSDAAPLGPVASRILALLTAHPHGLSGDSLMEALWPDPRQRPTRSNLRLHLSRLRRVLASGGAFEPIRRHNDRYAIDVTNVPIDAIDLERALQTFSSSSDESFDELDRTVGLWRGTPYAGIDDLEVVATERSRLEGIYLEAVVVWARAHGDRGSIGQTLGRLGAALELSPYSEGVARCLVGALHQVGRSRDALNAHDAFCRRLRDDIGLEPSPSFAELAASILRHRPLERSTATTVEHTTAVPATIDELVDPRLRRLAEDPCRGRGDDIEWIIDGVIDQRHRCSVLLIEGEAGIGKSRTMAEAAAELAGSGVTTAYGRASGADVAYEPWSAVVRSLRRRLPAAAIERLPGFVVGALAALDPQLVADTHGRPSRSLDTHLLPGAMAALLELAASTRPLAVVLEDLHAFDAASEGLLRSLIEAGVDGVTIVVTTRPPGVAADHAMRDQLIEHYRTHVLTGLRPKAAHDLLADVAGEISQEGAWRLHRLTRGNPLVLRQLSTRANTDAFIDELVLHSGELMDVIYGSLASLPDETVALLSRAAVCGLDFDVASVARLAGRDVDVVLDELVGPVRRGIITNPDADGISSFTHAAFHQRCHDNAPGPLRRELHAKLALQTTIENDDDEVRRAWHCLEAGESLSPDQVLGITQAAADTLSRRGAHAQLADLVERATSTRLRSTDPEVRLHRARALCRLGRWSDGREEFLEIWEWARTAGALDVMTTAAIEIDDAGRNVRLVGDRHRLLREVIDVHANAGESASPMALLASAEYVGEAIQFGRGLDARATQELEVFAEENLEHARRLGRPTVLGACLFARSAASSWRPVSENRIAWLSEARALADATGDLLRMHHVAGTLVRNQFEVADTDGASEAARDHSRSARASRHPRVVWFAMLRDACLAQMRGDFGAAATQLETMYAYGARFELPDNDGGFGAAMFMQLHHQGALASIRPLVDSQVELAPHNPLWVVGAAMAATADGDREAATQRLATMTATLDELPRNEFWPGLLCLLAETAWALGDRDAGALIRRELEPWSGRFVTLGMMISTMGPADRYLAMLADLLGESSDLLWRRAAVLCDRIGAAAWSARCEADQRAR